MKLRITRRGTHLFRFDVCRKGIRVITFIVCHGVVKDKQEFVKRFERYRQRFCKKNI